MLYTYPMSISINKAQSQVLKALEGKAGDFYLAGGTALSLFYFHHRQSDDLDFFTQSFSVQRVSQVVDYLSRHTKKKIELAAQNLSRASAEIMVYELEFAKGRFLRIDFVRDYLPLIAHAKPMEGINVLSLEDIYLRKIYAVSGAGVKIDEAGRNIPVGGRQEAKDLFDIYFLSHTFMGLAAFADKFCDQARREGLIHWFRTFSRQEMKIGLSDIKTDKTVEFKDMDRHIAGQIDKILKKEIGSK